MYAKVQKKPSKATSASEPFNVYPYHPETLIDVIARESRCSPEVVAEKTHLFYFREYFEYIKAATIVVERRYIDRDYLEDFAAYYVRCFHPYARECVRLHFFKTDFSETDLKNLLRGSRSRLKTTTLNEGYLGFVVIKPLPRTIIGRTCLTTYDDKSRRRFPIARQYDANLFGIKLTVKNSLAFQEQDNVVSACATSALWSVFQGTGMLFHHRIPSPVEITRTASEYLSATKDRTFPNSNLKPEMMANAIRQVGLEPYPIEIRNDEYSLTSNLYAYLRCGIPVIMGMALVDTTLKESDSGYLLDDKHAVAVTGFSLGRRTPRPEPETKFLLRASRIDKIYVHDDQVGPFARMTLDEQLVKIPKKNSEAFSLGTSWPDSNKKNIGTRAVPDLLMVPIYHKIRIPYETVEDAVIIFDSLLELLRINKRSPLKRRIEWDIFLSTVNDLKAELLRAPGKKSEQVVQLILKSLPHFVWRATAFDGKRPLMDLLFDATDIEQGDFFICPIMYDAVAEAYMKDFFRGGNLEKVLASNQGLLDTFKRRPGWQIVRWFEERRRS